MLSSYTISSKCDRFVASREQNDAFPEYPEEDEGGSVFIFDPPPPKARSRLMGPDFMSKCNMYVFKAAFNYPNIYDYVGMYAAFNSLEEAKRRQEGRVQEG